MREKTADQIRDAVRADYAARARKVAGGGASACCGDSETVGTTQRFYEGESYAGESIDDMPDSVVSYGCGNPLAIAGLRHGEVILDLGSGAGLDCFLAAQRVGPEGRVIGLDMTDEMLSLAEQNRAKLGVANVEFRKGLMEALPVADASVDVIISNCVINLSPDKDAVFADALRALRPGGRLQVSDIVLLRELLLTEQEDVSLWTGCKAGALVIGDYISRLEAAGFAHLSIDVSEGLAGGSAQKPWRSGLISAFKPGGESKPRPRGADERIELVAPPGLESAACCGEDCCAPER
ncbi:MAG TPA: arsenite methyltransferase [Dehalococcoidia bacterium]|nr:arsenite methyltransferase [Dehalococcoidia bacterium]